jgi:hypothetical protein
MKFKCPDCGDIEKVTSCTMEDLKRWKEDCNPLRFRCLGCKGDFDVLDNIEYEPPTGGTGEVELPGTIETIPNMSLRDYFAGQAIKHLISRKRDGEFSLPPKKSAEMAYQIADAMLKERNK